VTSHVRRESSVLPFFLEKRKRTGYRGAVVFGPGLASQDKKYTALAVDEGPSVAVMVVNKREWEGEKPRTSRSME
jgi:hypothetical protein